MPHGESWFSFLPFYEAVVHFANQKLGRTVMGFDVRVQHVISFVFILVLLTFAGLLIRKRSQDPDKNILPHSKLTPLSFIELIVSTTYGMMSDMMGKKAAKFFLPLVGTCALMIFFSNALGLIPGFLPPTDNLNTTFAMAGVIFIVTHIFGIKEHGFVAYFKHFRGPDVPWWIAWFIYPLMFIIETISHLARPLTLGIRLMANMTADHMVLGIFFSLFAAMGAWWLPVPVAMYFMGCIVVTVQTLVFCLLSTVYFSMAIAHEEH